MEILDGKGLDGFPPLWFLESKGSRHWSRMKHLLTPNPANFPPSKKTSDKYFFPQQMQPWCDELGSEYLLSILQ